MTRGHETCNCPNSDLSVCNKHCNNDKNCKGYVEKFSVGGCQIATISICPTGCTKTSFVLGNHGGSLLVDDELWSNGFGGCYIKIGNSYY